MSSKKNKQTTTAKQASRISDAPAEAGMAAEFYIPLFEGITIGLSLLAALLYVNTLGHGYVLDDLLAMGENELVRKGPSGIWELLSSHYRAGTEGAESSALLYRPLSLISFALEWSIAQGSPFFGHLMNVLWYAATVGLVFNTLRITFQGYHWLWAAGSALLFAVHPLHTEVVANIKSRDEILSLFFCVAALYVWVRALQRPGVFRTVLALFFYFLALLSKESAVTFWPAFLLTGWFFFEKTPRQSASYGLLFALPVAIFLVIRALVLSHSGDHLEVNPLDNPIVEASGFGERAATGFMALWQYLRLLVFPHPLVSDYSYRHLTVVGWTHWQALFGVVVYGGLAIWAIRSLVRRQTEAFLILMFLSGVVLYSQLVVVIGTLLGERLMYAPSLWFCAGIVLLLLKGVGWALMQENTKDLAALRTQRGGVAVVSLLVLLSVFLSLKTVNRNFDWADNLSLFSADVQYAPASLRLQSGIANELGKRLKSDTTLTASEREGMLTRMESHARAANEIRPSPNAYLNLGNGAAMRQQYQEAIAQYDSALVLSPAYDMAKYNISRCYLALGKKENQVNKNPEEAAKMFGKSIEYNPKEPEAHIGLGTSYGMLRRHLDALTSFEKAAELDPNNLYVWRFLAFAHRANGNAERAAACEEKMRALQERK